MGARVFEYNGESRGKGEKVRGEIVFQLSRVAACGACGGWKMRAQFGTQAQVEADCSVRLLIVVESKLISILRASKIPELRNFSGDPSSSGVAVLKPELWPFPK